MSHSNAEARTRIAVELERNTEPATGWLEDERGERTRFAGLLELLALLEAARVASDERSA